MCLLNSTHFRIPQVGSSVASQLVDHGDITRAILLERRVRERRLPYTSPGMSFSVAPRKTKPGNCNSVSSQRCPIYGLVSRVGTPPPPPPQHYRAGKGCNLGGEGGVGRRCTIYPNPPIPQSLKPQTAEPQKTQSRLIAEQEPSDGVECRRSFARLGDLP